MHISVFDVYLSFSRHRIHKMDTYWVQFSTESCPLTQDIVESLNISSAWGLRGRRNRADNEAQMQPECVEHLMPVSLTFCPFTPPVPAAPGWPCGRTPLLMTLMQQCGKCHSGGKIHTGSPFSPFSTAAPIPPCEWREQIGDGDRQPRHGSNRQRSGQISGNVQLFLIMQQITARLCCDMQSNEKLQPLLHCSIFHHFPTKPIPQAAKRWHLMTATELQGGHLIRPLLFMSGWKDYVHMLVEPVLRRTGGNFSKCSADSHTYCVSHFSHYRLLF